MPRFDIRLLIAALVLTLQPLHAAEPAAPAATERHAPSQEELEKQFEQKLSGATLIGHYTLNNGDDEKASREERYTISKVTKLTGDYWRFDTRIQYGNHDVTLPLPLQVKWAGDTPVITLTDVVVPGLGTFTARVLIYRDQYAGTWSGGDHGGHLYGKVEKANGQPQEPEGKAEPPAPAPQKP